MALYFESVLSSNVELKCFDAIILEFDDRTASGADQMIVMRFFVRIFKSGDAVFKPAFLDETGFGEQFHGTVHSRKADTRVYFFNTGVQLLGAQMSWGFRENLKDVVPLARGSEAPECKIFGQLFNG
jgi:hypothetical protein